MRPSRRVLTFEIHLMPLLVFLVMVTISFRTLPQRARAEDSQKQALNVAAPDPQGATPVNTALRTWTFVCGERESDSSAQLPSRLLAC